MGIAAAASGFGSGSEVGVVVYNNSGIATQLQYHAHTRMHFPAQSPAYFLTAGKGEDGDALVAHHFGDAFDHLRLVHLIGNFGDDDRLAILADLFDMRLRAHDHADRLLSVVYLESAPLGAFEQRESGRAVMDQRNEAFAPHVLAVTTGTTVEFPNSDRIYHNVFSLSKTRTFDLGRYAVGRSKSVRFDRPGIVRVFCDIHSHNVSVATEQMGNWLR